MLKKRMLCIALLAGLAGSGVGAVAADAAPAEKPTAEINADVKPGDCAGCHKDAKVLPRRHTATLDLALKDCRGCHGAKKEGAPDALETSVPLGHIHALKGVQCGQCHQKGEAVSMARCLTCHDPEEVARKTADLPPTNPHNSRHFGTEADCNLCHHQHKRSENDCASCHNLAVKFDFKVP